MFTVNSDKLTTAETRVHKMSDIPKVLRVGYWFPIKERIWQIKERRSTVVQAS